MKIAQLCNSTSMLSALLPYLALTHFQWASAPMAAALALGFALLAAPVIQFLQVFNKSIIRSRDGDGEHSKAPRKEFDERRGLSYPPIVPNTWYALAHSDEITSEPKHLRALGQSFVVWRTRAEGKLVVQAAWCPHQGANLGVDGLVTDDDCLVCPFHRWKFNSKGDVVYVPAAKDPCKPQPQRKLKTFPSVDWAGMACVYFHADEVVSDVAPSAHGCSGEAMDCEVGSNEVAINPPTHNADAQPAVVDKSTIDCAPPPWQLPVHVSSQLAGEPGWVDLARSDFGLVELSPIDWVDQAGDHSHFNELHSQMLIPWTTYPLPDFIRKLLPITINHTLETYTADSEEWKKSPTFTRKSEGGFPLTCEGKEMMFFTDNVIVKLGDKELPTTKSETIEMYAGPAIMLFHIPFSIGCLKVAVCTTPMEGHSSIMRVHAFVNSRSWLIRAIGWVVLGVSASQLAADISILSNRLRLRKPLKQHFDGPQARVNTWLKQFYTPSSAKVGKGKFLDW